MDEIRLAKFSDLEGYVQASTLTDYAKTSELTDYAKTSELTDYAKTSELTDYAKTTDLEGYVKTDGAKVLSDKNFTAAEETKLKGIEAGANKYTLPETLPSSMIDGLKTKLSEFTNDENFVDGTYDNTTSGLEATTIKEAIDELKGMIDALAVE